jgi:NAD(P) transhydrogenase subunit beta
MSAYSDTLIEFGYIAASILFILGIRMLGKPELARRGNLLSSVGMLIAVVASLFECCLSFTWVVAGLVVGSLIGVISARSVKMTAMPQMVALLNGFGGLASLLVGWENYHSEPDSNLFIRIAILLAVLIGGVAFSGSLIAYGKLAERIPGKPVAFRGQPAFTAVVLALILSGGAVFAHNSTAAYAYLWPLWHCRWF